MGREQIESQIVDINFASVIFLSVLTHFLPPWADVLISVVVTVWNIRMAAKLARSNGGNLFVLSVRISRHVSALCRLYV